MHSARPTSNHRPSGSATGSLNSRQSRPHSHSLSAGSINQAHRVTRRKSMSTTSGSLAAAAAAAAKNEGRRASKSSFSPRGPSFPNSLPNNSGFEQAFSKNASAVADGPPLSTIAQEIKGQKARIRRASEGSRLSKGESKRQSGSELRCETCGKGYKHSSCLTKHLWEHTPEWAYTSKLLISKHQQVQLLEAASVLVAMNLDPPEGASDSASPAASGSSDPREDTPSSTGTTPPPQLDDSNSRSYGHSKRASNTSSIFSRSYQSGASVFSESAPNSNPFGHYRNWSADQRPSTSATSVSGSQYDEEDQADLAAAVGLLSCSYGTPKTGPSLLPPDVPPVPPLPARYLDSASGSTPKMHHYSIKEVEMDDSEGEREYQKRTMMRGRSDEEDDVFRMEE